MFPKLEPLFPELLTFVESLARDHQAGLLDSWQGMDTHIEAFFTPDIRQKMIQLIPGWERMASFRNGVTQTHVITVLLSLLQLPEYQQSAPDQQAMMHWIVLFHDVAKEALPGQRDWVHGFRSAAITGRTLPALGFPIFAPDVLAQWAEMTAVAITTPTETGQPIQDNCQLPEIIAGIERIFGANTPAALIVKTVLLHMSITVLAEWPQAAPLTEDEILRYVDRTLWPLLRMMMLVDNDAWAFFEPDRKAQDRAETLVVFAEIEQNVFS